MKISKFQEVGPGLWIFIISGFLIFFDCFRFGFVPLAYSDIFIVVLVRFDVRGGRFERQGHSELEFWPA